MEEGNVSKHVEGMEKKDLYTKFWLEKWKRSDHLEKLYTADSLILGFHIVNRYLRVHKGL